MASKRGSKKKKKFPGLNFIMVTGKINQELVLREAANKTPYVFFVLHNLTEVNNKIYNEYFEIKVFKELAENVVREFKMGDDVWVQGVLHNHFNHVKRAAKISIVAYAMAPVCDTGSPRMTKGSSYYGKLPI